MITLGRHSYVGSIQERFDPIVEVGNFTSIASDVVFYGNCQHPWVMDNKCVSNYPFCEKQWGEYTRCGSRGKITIGSDVWVGDFAKILDGVTIGDGAIVGNSAVVTSNIPPFSVFAGNPGKVIKYRFNPLQIEELLKIKWWNKTDEEIKALKLNNIYEFMEGQNG